MISIQNPAVARVFAAYPVTIRRRLLRLRALIYDVAASLDGVGEIEETLKWGQPAYLTPYSKSGSTVRLGWKASEPTQYAMHFHCQTNLIETFRTQFPRGLRFEGNRSILFEENDTVPIGALSTCVAAAFTYHHAKKRAARRP